MEKLQAAARCMLVLHICSLVVEGSPGVSSCASGARELSEDIELVSLLAVSTASDILEREVQAKEAKKPYRGKDSDNIAVGLAQASSKQDHSANSSNLLRNGDFSDGAEKWTSYCPPKYYGGHSGVLGPCLPVTEWSSLATSGFHALTVDCSPSKQRGGILQDFNLIAGTTYEVSFTGIHHTANETVNESEPGANGDVFVEVQAPIKLNVLNQKIPLVRSGPSSSGVWPAYGPFTFTAQSSRARLLIYSGGWSCPRIDNVVVRPQAVPLVQQAHRVSKKPPASETPGEPPSPVAVVQTGGFIGEHFSDASSGQANRGNSKSSATQGNEAQLKERAHSIQELAAEVKNLKKQVGKATKDLTLRDGRIKEYGVKLRQANAVIQKYLSQDQPHWQVIYSSGSYGHHMTDEESFNKAVFGASREDNVIIRRECSNCPETHKDIYYRRFWGRWNPWSELLNVFPSKAHGKNFNLYSAFEDAIHDRNPWKYCHGNAVVGFPRDCSPKPDDDAVREDHQVHWNSLMATGIKDYKFSVYWTPPNVPPEDII